MADTAAAPATTAPPASEPQESRPRAQSPQQPFEAENTVEADTDDGASSRADETWDEGFDSASSHSASTSMSASVRDYVFENTRRYHKYMEGRYLLPNDEPEQDREDMKHAMCVNVMDGKLHSAPLENPQKIVDIGTGTGIWAIDSRFSISLLPSLRGSCCLFLILVSLDPMLGMFLLILAMECRRMAKRFRPHFGSPIRSLNQHMSQG